MALDRSNWPRCLLWHGWLLGLTDVGERDPWATSFGDLACCKLECRLGAYPSDTFFSFWTPPDYWDADDIALEMSEVLSLIGGFEVAGAGVYKNLKLKKKNKTAN